MPRGDSGRVRRRNRLPVGRWGLSLDWPFCGGCGEMCFATPFSARDRDVCLTNYVERCWAAATFAFKGLSSLAVPLSRIQPRIGATR